MERPPIQPLISVVIPTYNRADLIERAVTSVVKQDYKNLEVIVVDDGSKDNTSQVVKELQDKYSNLIYLPQESNSGGNITRNIGLKKARGQYIAFLDSDDEWLPGKLAKEIDLFRGSTDPKLGMVYSGIKFIFPSKTSTFTPSNPPELLPQLLADCVILGGASSGLIHRRVFEAIGYFDEDERLRFGGAQEYELWIRIAEKFTFAATPEVLVNYYVLENSVTTETAARPSRRALSREYILNKYLFLYRRYPKIWAWRHLVVANFFFHAGDRKKVLQHLLLAFKIDKRFKYFLLLVWSVIGWKSFLPTSERICQEMSPLNSS